MKPSVLITGAIVLTGWMFIDGYKTDAGNCGRNSVFHARIAARFNQSANRQFSYPNSDVRSVDTATQENGHAKTRYGGQPPSTKP